MNVRYLWAAAVGALISVSAMAQTIPSPAGSTDSGARATVGIAPVDLSSYATKTEVNNVAYTANVAYETATTANTTATTANNTAITAFNTSNTAYSVAVTQSSTAAKFQSWGKFFPNTWRCNSGGFCLYIDDGGLFHTYLNGQRINLGYAEGMYPVAAWFVGFETGPNLLAKSSGGSCTWMPFGADSAGNPTNWGYIGQRTAYTTYCGDSGSPP